MFIAVLHTKCRARSRTRSRIARSALPFPQLAEFFRAIPSSTSGVATPPRSSAVSGSIVEVRPGASAFQIGTCPRSRQWIELWLRCAKTFVVATTSDFTVLFRARHGAGGATSMRAGYQGFARRTFEHAKHLVRGNTDSARCSGTLEDRGVTLKSVYILGSIFIFASEQEYMLPKWALLHIQSHFC